MQVLLVRILLPLALLWLLGLTIAWVVTKRRTYLELAKTSLWVMLLAFVALGLLYLLERLILTF